MSSQFGLINTSRPSGYAAKLNMLVYLSTTKILKCFYIYIKKSLFVCFIKQKVKIY